MVDNSRVSRGYTGIVRGSHPSLLCFTGSFFLSGVYGAGRGAYSEV